MGKLNVMVVDTSARAHAVADAYLRDPDVDKVIMTEGNELCAYMNPGRVILTKASHKNPASVIAVAEAHKVGLVDVCQDDALALGTVDKLKANGVAAFGASQAAAQIESDKAWSRKFMHDHDIPHPAYASFNDEQLAFAYINCKPERLRFVKASGLCAGKGAIATRTRDEAIAAVKSMASFGEAGKKFLIEEGMVGEEASIYSFSDGEHARTLKSAQDHKRRNNYELGPNTGGMGAVSPAGVVTPALMEEVQKSIISKAINGMREDKNPYVGVLYTSIMATEDGPKVVEFNARWGAPEAEVVVPGIKTPMSKIVRACIDGNLHMQPIEEDDLVRVCVVGASRGYPENVSAVKGKRIFGLEDVMRMPGVKLYGAGIAVKDGKFYANGGRLFSISAEGSDILEARSKALTAMSFVYIEGNNLQYRTDIGWRDVERHLSK